ncbi:MAG: type II toxin-antitoxin system VapC family toxin [Bryobacteraceae bacterium]
MKRYLVDTNIPSEFTHNQPDTRVMDFIQKAGKDNLFLSVMTLGEICKGIDLLPVSRRRSGLQDWLDLDVRAWFAGRILPVTETIAERWGHMAAAARKQGITLAVVDGVIAATAIEHNLTLVTRNAKDYGSLGVALLNPWDAV